MPAPKVENKIVRQRPKHLHEGDQQNRGLQQADTEIGGQLGQMACVLVHTLIGIHAHRAGGREPEGAARLQPVLNQITRQALTEPELQCFAEPPLSHVEHQQRSGNQTKDAQLHHELRKIAAGQCIIEGLVPVVEAYLSESAQRDDEE
jgi:hypothetical protein